VRGHVFRYVWVGEALPGQRPFLMDMRHRFIALEGGLGAGKTRAGAWKAWHLHACNAFDGGGRPTYAAGAIIGDTYQNLERYDLPAFREMCDAAGATTEVRRRPFEIVVNEFGTKARPSVVHLCTAERPDRISGFSVGWFWGDEAARWKQGRGDPKDDALVQAMGRLRDERVKLQQGIFTYTNEGDGTSVYQFMRLRDAVTGELMNDRAVYVASTRDNVHVERFLSSQLATLSPDLVKQYVDGEAICLRGARAYTLFEREEHVSDDAAGLVPGEGVPLCLAVDFNINPGMHALVGQYRRAEDVFLVTHEIHGPRMDVRTCMRRFVELVAQLGGIKRFRGVYLYADATGRSAWAGTSESCYTVMMQCLDAGGLRGRYRMRTRKNNPRVTDRIHAVQCALRDVQDATHVMIHPRCRGLIEDMEETKWDEEGRELDKRRVDVSHFSDALGYWISRVRPVVLVRGDAEGGRVAIGR